MSQKNTTLVILHKPTESLWLVDNSDELPDDSVFITELENSEDGLQCLECLSRCTDNPITTVDMAMELGVANIDECCIFLRVYSDKLLDKIDKIINKKENKPNDYFN